MEKTGSPDTKKSIRAHTALLLVDIQNDFMPGGSLEVIDGDMIIPAIEHLIQLPFDTVIASKDWHPKNHVSFAATHRKQVGDILTMGKVKQILWPVHCVENTAGSEFYPGWDTTKVQKTFHKGTNPLIDSYSAFFDNERIKSTGLGDYLQRQGVDRIFIAGLTTEYCVKYSALDAISMGFHVYVVSDACRGVNLHQNDSKKALKEMEAFGAVVVTSDQVKKLMGRKKPL